MPRLALLIEEFPLFTIGTVLEDADAVLAAVLISADFERPFVLFAVNRRRVWQANNGYFGILEVFALGPGGRGIDRLYRGGFGRPDGHEFTLEDLGYEILIAKNRDEAVQMIKKSKKPVLLVLAGIKIPGIKTEEFVSQIKKINTKTKIIFMTDHSEKKMKLYGCGYIRKPFEVRQLANKIRKTIDD